MSVLIAIMLLFFKAVEQATGYWYALVGDPDETITKLTHKLIATVPTAAPHTQVTTLFTKHSMTRGARACRTTRSRALLLRARDFVLNTEARYIDAEAPNCSRRGMKVPL